MSADRETVTPLLGLLIEVYESPTWEATWIVTNEPRSGIFGTLDQLDAASASQRPLDGAHSVLAHMNHLRVSLEAALVWLSGSVPQVDWEGSWLVESVDDRGWEAERRRLRDAYERVRARYLELGELDGDGLCGLAATIGHGAYHLGAIRQLAAPCLARSGRPEPSPP